MSLANASKTVMAETRRGLILQLIAQTGNFGLSHSSLQEGFDRLGRPVGIDALKRDVQWLDESLLVEVSLDGGIPIAKLTPNGEDVAHGRVTVEGVRVDRRV